MKYCGLVLFALLTISITATVFGNENIRVYKASENETPLYSTMGIALTESKVLLLADAIKNVINSIDDTNIERFAGVFGEMGSLDDHADLALFDSPTDIAIDADGNIYICDSGNHSIRKISAETGEVITVIPRSAGLNRPTSIAFDPEGNLYISDTLNHSIKIFDTEGKLSLFAGVNGRSGLMDGTNTNAFFFEPAGLTFSDDGILYIVDSANHAIRKIEDGFVTTIAGRSNLYNRTTGYPIGGYVDGHVDDAQFNFPKDIVVHLDKLYVADTFNHAIRLIDGDEVFTILGNGAVGQDYHSIRNMKLNKPYSLLIQDQELYVADSGNFSVVKLPLQALSPKLNRNDVLSRLLNFEEPTLYVNNIQFSNSVSMLEQRESSFFARVATVLPALGYQVSWNPSDSSLTVLKDGGFVRTLHYGIDFELVNNFAIVNLSDLCELFDLQFEWFPRNNLVAIIG